MLLFLFRLYRQNTIVYQARVSVTGGDYLTPNHPYPLDPVHQLGVHHQVCLVLLYLWVALAGECNIPFTHPDRHVPGFLCVNLIKHVIILSVVVNIKVAAFILFTFIAS